MKKIVMKFGGTSVQDSSAITNVINIVRSSDAKLIVVVSAIAKATNSLEQMAHLAAESKETEANELLNELINRHHKIIKGQIKNSSNAATATEKIMNNHREITELIKGVSIINDLSLRTLDSFRVFGELMSSTIIYFAMLSNDIDAELVDSRQIIKTDNEFSRAYPDFELTQKNINEKILPLFEKNKIILTQGFIGSTIDNKSTTMGRESSDFSAAIYGSCINADEIQIWTDVDGVLTCDPNLIPEARKLSQLSFQEMEELSNFGAKVLHKNSVKPAFQKNIPLRILNSKNTSSSGTLINSELKYPSSVKSLTYKNNIVVLNLKPKEGLNQYVFWEMMLNILSKHKPQIDLFFSSNNAVTIVIAINNYTKIHFEELRTEFSEISEYSMNQELALVTLVGSDLRSVKNLEQRIFISAPHLEASSIVFGFNPHSFSMLVKKTDMNKTLSDLHKEFFGEKVSDDGLFEKAFNKELLIA